VVRIIAKNTKKMVRIIAKNTKKVVRIIAKNLDFNNYLWYYYK